jgi:predicted dehydrogenase
VVNVAIVGCGRISGLHAQAYLTHPHAKIVAICDNNEDLLASRGDEWGVPADSRYGSLDELLTRSDLDFVDLLVPHHLHFSFASKVINAGVNLSLQKPMTVTLADATALIELAQSKGVTLKVFENFVFFPPIVLAKKLVEQGEIGDLLGIRMKSHSGYSPTMWEIPPATQEWRLKPDECGGGPLVFDDGHHKFAVAWHFLGAVDSVFAAIGNWKGTGIDSPSVVSWTHQSGAIGSLEVIYSPEMLVTTKYYAQDDQLEISGTKGTIWVTKGHGQIRNLPPVMLYSDGVEKSFDVDSDWGTSFVDSGQHFVDALRGGTEPILTGQQGREILEFTLAAQQSSQTRSVISVGAS